MSKRIGKYLVGIAAVCGAFVGTLLFVATSETGSQFISEKLRAQVLSATEIDIAFANIDLDLLPPRIRIVDIQAADNQKRIVCTAEEIEFSPSPIDLFRGTLTIEEVYVGSPTCEIRLNKENIDNLDQYFKKSDDPNRDVEFDFSQVPAFEVFAVSTASLKAEIDDPGRLGQISAYLNGFGVDITGGDENIEIRGLLKEAAVKWKKEEDQLFERLVQLNFRASLSPRSFDIRHLDSKIAGADVKLNDAHIPIPLWPEGPEIAELSVNLPLELFERLPLGLPTMYGQAGFFGQAAVRKDSDDKIGVSARGQLTLDQGVIDDFVIGDLVSVISLTPAGFSFADTELRTAEGHIRARGNIAFDEQLSTTLNLKLDSIELAHLLEQLTVTDSYVYQKMTGPIELEGQLKPFQLNGTMQIAVEDHTVTLGSFRSQNPDIALQVPKVFVGGNIALTDRFVSGQNLLVRTGETALDTNLHVDFDTERWTLNTASNDFHLDDVEKIIGFDVAGHGPLKCTISGLLSKPNIKGTIDFDKLVFAGFFIDQATATVKYRDGLLTFQNLTTERPQGSATTQALTLDFDSKHSLHITAAVDVQSMQIEDITKLFSIDTESYGSPTGQATGRVTVDYALEPDRLKVGLNIFHNRVKVFSEQFGPGRLRANWNKGDLAISELRLKKGKGTVSISGSVDADQSMKFDILASGIRSRSLNTPELKELDLKTTGQLTAALEGTLKHPQGKGQILLGETIYKKTRYGGSSLKVSLDGTQISGNGKLAGGRALLNQFALDLQTNRFQVNGEIKNLDIIPITNLSSDDYQTSLSVTGEVVLSGKFDKNPDLNGQATLKQVKMVLDNLRFKNKKPLQIVSETNRFRILDTRFEGPEVVFDLGGTFGLSELDLRTRGQVNLNSTRDLFTWMTKSRGLLDFELRARGSYDSPSLRGKAELRDGMIKLAKFPYRIENIQGKAVLSPKIIRFTEFKAKSAGGKLHAVGDIQLSDGKISDYRFKLNAENLQLAMIDNLTFKASTIKDGLILRSGVDDQLPIVLGDLELKRLRYTQDIRIFELSDLSVDRLSGSRSRASKPKLVDARNDFFRFDIHLHGDRNIEARNNLFDADLAIDDVEKPLRIVGTNQIFGFLGRVKGKNGEVRFAGKRFDIKYASIEFKDPTRPSNPNFRVTADGQIRDWRVTMTAEGDVDEYELKFASQPYLPKEDIIFVILTGFTRAEQRQFGGSSLSIGAPLLGQFGPSSNAIPLEFRVYNDYSERSGTESTRVALGRWITPDIWVSVSSGVSDDRDVEADIDYKINDELSVSGGYENDNEGSVGNVGLDLKYRLEF